MTMTMTTLIHVTHEACEKMGGIGAVLEGMLTTRAYQSTVKRTIVVGTGNVPQTKPIAAIESIIYESGRGQVDGRPVPQAVLEAFMSVEEQWNARVLYADRRVACPMEGSHCNVELVLIDVRDTHAEAVNRLKKELWEAYGLESDKYQDDWGYEEWVRAAGPLIKIAGAMLGDDVADAAIISHEFMGVPAVLAARLRLSGLRTVYWAHEVPPVRDMIEQEAGHSLVFDAAVETTEGRLSYEARLRQWGGFKHALVSRAHHANCIFAVSDRIAKELHLLSPEFARLPVEVVYNGLPVRPISLKDRLESRARLRRYAQALLGFRPDYVFTHVARPVASKAIERDLVVMEHMDDILAERGQTAVLLVLATDAGRRDAELVRRMEAEYGWPVTHREGWPDLVKGEVPMGRATGPYNAWARATRVVLVNQFGFSRQTCGERMPAEMTFEDLRQGSDVEFGQSSYEPFGIAQLETLAFGGISVMSRSCGCANLVARVTDGRLPPNVLLAHYAAPAARALAPIPISEGDTRRIEHEVAAHLARELANRLPNGPDEIARLLATGWALAERMSWQAVCGQYFVPALERCMQR